MAWIMKPHHNYIIFPLTKQSGHLSSGVVQVVQAIRAGIFFSSYILNYQDLSATSMRNLPQSLVYQATIVGSGFIR